VDALNLEIVRRIFLVGALEFTKIPVSLRRCCELSEGCASQGSQALFDGVIEAERDEMYGKAASKHLETITSIISS
jgi:hypothetical protein